MKQALARALAVVLLAGSLLFFYYAGRFLIEGGHATLTSDNPRDAEEDVIPGLLVVTALLASPGVALVIAARRLWSRSRAASDTAKHEPKVPGRGR